MIAEPVRMAFTYDFDGTLAKGDMQEYDLVPKFGLTPREFWKKAEEIRKEYNVDGILAYMYLIVRMAREQCVSIRRNDFSSYGRNIEYFRGVDTWFDRINRYGKSKGVEISHYIISSGLKEMIEGTPVARHFKAIFASTYLYDQEGNPVWPARAVNYTNKTQYIFRLNKGVLDETDDVSVNAYQPRSDRNMPFSHIIYFGDGATDIPCMRLVKNFGGHSIMVYDENNQQARKNALDYVQKNRISLAATNDYSSGSMLERGVKLIIDAVVASSRFDGLRSVEQD